MRIFLDANILFSAANPSGSIRQLLNIARAAGHECWADEHVHRLEAPLPENDRRVLAAAIALECNALVSGDQTHFGPLYGKTVDGIRIYSPRQLAEDIVK